MRLFFNLYFFLYIKVPNKFRLFKENDKENNYQQAINEIEKFEMTTSFTDKFDLLVTTNTAMKTTVIEFYKGKEELISMDDELPVLLFILIKCKCKNLFAQLSLVEDFLSLLGDIDYERRFIMNFKVNKYIAIFKLNFITFF